MNPFAIVGDLARRHADIPRPILAATVADVSGWAALGASWIMVDVAGGRRRAIYRDGRAPLVGEVVQAILTGPHVGDPYLAFPLPQGTPSTGGGGGGGIVFVLYDTSATTYGPRFNSRLNDPACFIVAAYDPATQAWTKRADYPVSDADWRSYNVGPRSRAIMPLVVAGARLLTYAIRWSSPWTVNTTATYPNCHASDDGGTTWTPVAGLVGVQAIKHGAGGRLFALTLVGDIKVSTDNGVTWTLWTHVNFTLPHVRQFNGSIATDTAEPFDIAPDPATPLVLTVEAYPAQTGGATPAFFTTSDGGATWGDGLGPQWAANDATPLTIVRPWGGTLAANLRTTLRLQADPFPAQDSGYTRELAVAPVPFAFAPSRADAAAYAWVGDDGYLYYGARDSTAGAAGALGLIRTRNGATWEHAIDGTESWIPTATEGGVAARRIGVGSSLTIGGDRYAAIATAALDNQWRGDEADYDALTVTARGPRLVKRVGTGWADASGDYLAALARPDDGLGLPWAYAIMPGRLTRPPSWRFVFSASQRGRNPGAWHHALLGVDAAGRWGIVGPHPFTQERWLAAMAGYVSNAAYYAYPEYTWLPLARIGARLYAWALAMVQNDAHPDGSRVAVDAPNCYVSDDGGATWALGPLRGVWALTPNDGGLRHYAVADDGMGIYRTVDGGVTWTRRATFAADNRVQSLSVDPADADNLAVGAAQGIATSGDGGATWTVRYAAPLVNRPRDPRDNVYATNPWTPQSTYPAVAVGRSGTRTVFAFTPDRAYTIGIHPYIRAITQTDGTANPYYHPEMHLLGHVDDGAGGHVRDLDLAYRQPEDLSLSYIANPGWATVAGMSTFVRRAGTWLWLTQGPRQYTVPQVPNRVVLRDPTGTGTGWTGDLVTPGGGLPEDELIVPATFVTDEVHQGLAGGAMGGIVSAADGLYLALSGSPDMVDDFPRDDRAYGFYPRLLRSIDDGATWTDVTGGDYRAALAAPDGSGGDYVLQPYGIARGDAP